MPFVIFDLEYTTWEGTLSRGWSGPGEHREVVQIAAIKVDNDLNEIGALDILVKPRINPVVSDHFVDLTGITNEKIQAEGITFSDAYNQFRAFALGHRAISYGNDASVFAENSGLLRGKFDEEPINPQGVYFINVSGLFKALDPETRGLNSGKLANHYQRTVDADGGEHNALYDCRSILEGLKALLEKHPNDPSLQQFLSDSFDEIALNPPSARKVSA